MATSRRLFIRDGFRAAITVSLLLGSSRLGIAQKTRGQVKTTIVREEIPLEAQQEPTFLFNKSTFDPYVGGYFTGVNSRGEVVELKLLTAKAFRSNAKLTSRTRPTDSFTLTFSASSHLPPFTSIHRINHPALGEFYLFLTFRSGENGELLYEAVFNHVK